MRKLTKQQEEAREHLSKWRVGALFMEAGTGKTRTAVELVNTTDCDLVLWVAPLRTLSPNNGIASIPDEINKWGGFKCKNVLYYGIESISQSDRIYTEMLNKIATYKNVFCVVDESLKIKNSDSKRTKRLLQVSKLENIKYKLILNGTPLSKNIMDLYSQMEFLSPKILNMTYNQYKNTFCCYKQTTKYGPRGNPYVVEYITKYANIDYLYSLIKDYVYECELSLNITQNYYIRSYHLTEEEHYEYAQIKDYYLNEDTLGELNDNIFFAMTQKMQHSYCCSENKFKVVDKLFEEIPQEQTIIFCKYIQSQEECKKHYPKAMVLSYQKDSLGLNLQDYHYTIYFDKIWDLALRVQSGHRTFRTGQEQDCKYYDLTGDVGLEQLIDRNIDKKVSMTEYFKRKTKEEIIKEL